MANKIRIKKENRINKVSKENDYKYKAPFIIFLILFILSCFAIYVLYANLEEREEEYNNVSDKLESLTRGQTYFYTQSKLNFIDKHVVFQIEGYGNYYYTYECMLKKVGNNEYNFWAYNTEAAQGRGLKQGSC